MTLTSSGTKSGTRVSLSKNYTYSKTKSTTGTSSTQNYTSTETCSEEDTQQDSRSGGGKATTTKKADQDRRKVHDKTDLKDGKQRDKKLEEVPKNMRRRSALLVLFIAADVALSVVSMGFYSSSWVFDFSIIFKFLTFIDGYNYFNNPIDFVILAVLRLAFLVSAVALIAFHRDHIAKAMFMPMIGFATACYSYTLVKILAFSEYEIMMKYPGVWMSMVWSMAAALLFSLIWYFIITAHSFDYQRLVSERFNTAESVSDTDLETAREPSESYPMIAPPKRISTFQHIKALLKYCQHQWLWFTLGFIFLVIYAVGDKGTKKDRRNDGSIFYYKWNDRNGDQESDRF